MIKIELEKKQKQEKKKKETKLVNDINQKKKIEFSKQLLIYDYLVALVLLIIFFLCLFANGIYTMIITNSLIEMGMMYSTTPPFDLTVIGTILGIWAGQLAVSSAAYYFMAKEDHRVQIPMKLISDLPKDIKDRVDMTQIIVSALNINTN